MGARSQRANDVQLAAGTADVVNDPYRRVLGFESDREEYRLIEVYSAADGVDVSNSAPPFRTRVTWTMGTGLSYNFFFDSTGAGRTCVLARTVEVWVQSRSSFVQRVSALIGDGFCETRNQVVERFSADSEMDVYPDALRARILGNWTANAPSAFTIELTDGYGVSVGIINGSQQGDFGIPIRGMRSLVIRGPVGATYVVQQDLAR